jgi:hypothetical protein
MWWLAGARGDGRARCVVKHQILRPAPASLSFEGFAAIAQPPPAAARPPALTMAPIPCQKVSLHAGAAILHLSSPVSAKSTVGDFTLPPRDFSWDASVLKELGATAGSAITVWPNAGSAGAVYNAQAGTGSSTAHYQETAAGMPFVNFEQSYFELQGPGIAWRYSGGADAGVTTVAVVKMPRQAGYCERVFEFSHPDCTHAINMYRGETTLMLFATLDASFTDYSAAVILEDAIPGSKVQIFTGVASSTQTWMYRDGQLVGTASGFTPHTDRTTTLNYLGLSCWGVGSVVPMLTAVVHEISIWRRVLSHAELAQLHAQLAAKWGLAVSLAPPPPPPKKCALLAFAVSMHERCLRSNRCDCNASPCCACAILS